MSVIQKTNMLNEGGCLSLPSRYAPALSGSNYDVIATLIAAMCNVFLFSITHICMYKNVLLLN